MITKEQIKQRFDERHADENDEMFRALDKANGIEDKSRTQNIRFGVRDFYDSHDVEAMLRSTLAILCKYHLDSERTSAEDLEKITEFLTFNENVEYIKELEKELYK